MRVRTITYAMLRQGRQFENDRAEVTIDLDPGDVLLDVIDEAKRVCRLALDAPANPAPPSGDRSANARGFRPDPKNDRPIELYEDPR
jgi:hypothetical protein